MGQLYGHQFAGQGLCPDRDIVKVVVRPLHADPVNPVAHLFDLPFYFLGNEEERDPSLFVQTYAGHHDHHRCRNFPIIRPEPASVFRSRPGISPDQLSLCTGRPPGCGSSPTDPVIAGPPHQWRVLSGLSQEDPLRYLPCGTGDRSSFAGVPRSSGPAVP